MRILINAVSTKKHSGGAYQIAYNYIVKTAEYPDIDWVYVVSKDLDKIIPESIKEKGYYYVYPTQPDYRYSYRSVKKKLADLEARVKPDVVYSITAPSYFTFKSKEVMRFTMPWVTHPNKYSWSVLSWKERLRMKVYCWYQRCMMRKAHYFITQTEITRHGILRITEVPPQNVKVVQNVLPAIFKTLPSSSYPPDKKWLDISCVANTSAHKNLDILPKVIVELQKLGVENVRFHVTIPTGSVWNKMQTELREKGSEDRIVTHGRISQIELAELYRHCQLCFLPTLLEVFSASTLEAMWFHLPIVATDFDFNREVMADAALYYEPMNALQAAECIKEYIENPSLQRDMKEKMKKRLLLFSDYGKHFEDILSFLQSVAKGII